MDVFSFFIMFFFIFFTIQYNFHLISFLGVFAYAIAMPSLLNLLLVFFLIVISFFLGSFSVLLFPFSIVLIILIIVMSFIKKESKSQSGSDMSGLSGLEDLFK